MDSSNIASMLVTATVLRNRLDILKLDEGRMAEGILQLAEFRILSAGQIASILETTDYQVKKTLKQFSHMNELQDRRGKLNPLHLEALAYMLSLHDEGKINKTWVLRILDEGTSISTLSDLTGISEATLYRIKGEDNE